MGRINKDLVVVEAQRGGERKNLQGAEMAAAGQMILEVKIAPNAMLIGYKIRPGNGVESLVAPSTWRVPRFNQETYSNIPADISPTRFMSCAPENLSNAGSPLC